MCVLKEGHILTLDSPLSCLHTAVDVHPHVLFNVKEVVEKKAKVFVFLLLNDIKC